MGSLMRPLFLNYMKKDKIILKCESITEEEVFYRYGIFKDTWIEQVKIFIECYKNENGRYPTWETILNRKYHKGKITMR